MTIPMNAAGQAAFDVFYKIAKRVYARAQEAVDAYTAENCPGCITKAERHEDGRYKRDIQTPDGRVRTISYNYETREVEAA